MDDAIAFEQRINELLADSRFTCEVDRTKRNRPRPGWVTFSMVRLRESKPYCGNHAGPCRVNPFFHRPHLKGKWLEGADWVAFNDMVNDALDSLSIVADVSSSHCIIRKGRERCVAYIDGERHGGEWAKQGRYNDHCGKPIGSVPTSDYPNGTPGIDTWQASDKVAAA